MLLLYFLWVYSSCLFFSFPFFSYIIYSISAPIFNTSICSLPLIERAVVVPHSVSVPYFCFLLPFVSVFYVLIILTIIVGPLYNHFLSLNVRTWEGRYNSIAVWSSNNLTVLIRVYKSLSLHICSKYCGVVKRFQFLRLRSCVLKCRFKRTPHGRTKAYAFYDHNSGI